MSMSWVTVTDGDKDFHALTDQPNETESVTAWVFFPNSDNGFGHSDGVSVLIGLKKLGDGKFGA